MSLIFCITVDISLKLREKRKALASFSNQDVLTIKILAGE